MPRSPTEKADHTSRRLVLTRTSMANTLSSRH